MMLQLRRLIISGFRSFGKEETVLELSGLGPVLVVGHNGGGKTSTMDAILWCLFGRTANVDRPADRIINWNLSECRVTLETMDGYRITRTRSKGKGELCIFKDEVDVSDSTSANAQITLNKLFDLDFDLFTAGTFFINKPLLEFSETKRRRTLEHLLHLNRINACGEVTVDELKKIESDQRLIVERKESLEESVHELEESISSLSDREHNFETARKASIDEMIEERKTLSADLNNRRKAPQGRPIDVKALSERWAKWQLIQDKITSESDKLDDLRLTKLMAAKSDHKAAESLMKQWQEKSGTNCPKCLQKIDSTHAGKYAAQEQQKADALRKTVEDLEHRITAEGSRLKDAGLRLQKIEPEMTVREANSKNLELEAAKKQLQGLERELSELDVRIQSKRDETNPYGSLVVEEKQKLSQKMGDLADLNARISRYDKMIRHLSYLSKMYRDRNCLKSLVLTDLIPYLNERFAYYLDAMNMDVSMHFTESLQCKSDRWAYDLHSEGERKKIDVSLMFAIHDLHTAIYGSQCNVLVLDEVDGRLDQNGVQTFVEVLMKDVVRTDGSGPSTIAVMSHKQEMIDQFPTRMVVEKDEDGSKIHIENV